MSLYKENSTFKETLFGAVLIGVSVFIMVYVAGKLLG